VVSRVSASRGYVWMMLGMDSEALMGRMGIQAVFTSVCEAMLN